MVRVSLQHALPEGTQTMKLKDRFLFLVAVVVISASLFAGMFMIVDNFNDSFDPVAMRPTAAISPAGLMGGDA
jgi:hypothetical protein